MTTVRILGLTSVLVLLSVASAQADAPSSSRFQALKCPSPSLGQTWGILDRDGAKNKVKPYLSSLVDGSAATGMITSPPFIIDVDKITFTLCGYDGQAGGRDQNYIALVDARKGEVLLKTPAPQSDAMQERTWEVKNLRGTQVRIELRDGNYGGAYGWFGAGRIDAGPALQVDFQQGMPKGWAEPERKADRRFEVLTGGVAFKRAAGIYTLIPPKSGAVEVACGFAADRLYFLGCTISDARPLEPAGNIEVHYKTGSPEVYPLVCGFTLDDAGKLLSPCASSHLHASADPYQYYLVIKPRADVIDNIRLVGYPGGILPRITAITCETAAKAESLMPLPVTTMSPQEAAWIKASSISADTLDLNRIMEAIRAAHKLPASRSSAGGRKH